MSMFSKGHRVGMHRHFYRVAQFNRARFIELGVRLEALETESVADGHFEKVLEQQVEIYEAQAQAAVVGVTFAAMSLEAFFFDYAATNLDQRRAEELDKLSLPAKLLFIPELVCGRSVERAEAVYGNVKKLVKERNFLVHYKSKHFPLEELHGMSEYHAELNNRFRSAVMSSTETVAAVMRRLDELHERREFFYRKVCE